MRILCGIDMVSDKKIDTASQNLVFLDKLLQPSEKLLPSKLPSIFALKESVIKALELPAGSWLEIEVIYKSNGKTIINLSNTIKPSKLVSLDSSVSHQSGFTIGQVVMIIAE